MKIPLKLGIWFFLCMFFIETMSMIYLHTNIINSRVSQELRSLQARGNSHRDVLEISYKRSTLHHIGLMETHTDTEVVITDANKNIIITSRKINKSMKNIILKKIRRVPRQGLVLQPDWKNEQYISTVTTYNAGGKNKGYVFMFEDTNSVKTLISQLNQHFIVASVLVLFFMLITIFFLSKALTKPLISMIEATKKISKGNYSVSLPVPSKDEIGELSSSIKTLANDLSYLKNERNEFLASISHELRTPLTYVKGYADIARRKELNETERTKYLTIIYDEAERLSVLLEELFDLAKLDKNKFAINKEKINLSSYLHAVYEKMYPAYKNKGIDLSLECEDDINLTIDPNRFEQVLMNLLDNALKYSTSPATTYIKVFKKKDNIHILIKDEGYGIPKEDLPYIFDRLYRVDKSRNRATGGFGIGLAIVKQLVEALDGQIYVESELGEGTHFTIILKEY